jgi:hypothetical protein
MRVEGRDGVEGELGEEGGGGWANCFASALQDDDYLVVGVGVSVRVPPAAGVAASEGGSRGPWPVGRRPVRGTRWGPQGQ